MKINEQFLLELKLETKNTQRILDRIPDAQWDWKPHSKSRSLGELVCHVVELHNWVSGALLVDDFNFHIDYIPLQKSNIADVNKELSEGYEKNVHSLQSLVDEDWERIWTVRAGETVLRQMPKIDLLRYIINNHLIHHRGQLTVYLRLLDIPVPGLYGPSADEQ